MNNPNLKGQLRLLAILIAITITRNAALAQNETPTKVADFLIIIETSENEIRMTCNTGCAWKNLTFNPVPGALPQVIDQNGMTTLDNDQVAIPPNPNDFRFTIMHSEKEGVILKGLKGTAWLELSYGIRAIQTIDGYGMVSTD